MKKKTKFLTVGVMAMLVLVFSAMSVSAQEGSALPECKQHSYEDVIVPATVNADGYTLRRCSVCMTEKDKAIIRQIGGVKLSRTEYHFFNGKAYPDYTVCDADGNEIEEVYGYTVKKPSNPKKPGTYKYVVKFFGRYKGECTAYYKIENPSSTPVLKNIASTSKGVKLDWTLSKEVDYCLVFRKEGAGRWEEIAKVEDKCSYTDLTAVYGKTYSYTVKSYTYSYGTTVESDYDKNGLAVEVKNIFKSDKPVVTLKNKTAVIKWNKVSGATQYKIYRATSKKGEYKEIYTHKKGKLSYTDKNVKAGKTYYYKIRAFAGSESSKLSAYTKIYITLSAPVFQKNVTSTPTSVTFKWKKVADADYYVIYRKKTKKDSWKKIATVKSSKKLEYTDKIKGNYYYSIRAYEKLSSKKTIKSDMSEDYILGKMGKPIIKEIKLGGFSREAIIVSLLKNQPTRYQLYCKVGAKGKWKKVETGSVGAYVGDRIDEYNKNGVVCRRELKIDKTYYFKIRGYFEKGGVVQYGPFSDVKTIRLYYNPKVKVTLPKNEYKASTFPVTVKNNGSSALRVYCEDAVLCNKERENRDLIVFSVEGAKNVKGKYIEIPAGKTAKIQLLPRASYDESYSRESAVLLKFRYKNSDYYSAYSYKYGKSF